MQHWPYPKLFAHRGGGNLAPENTLPGMQKALALRFSAVEFDVKLTADNVSIVIHDDTLERTSNGEGALAELDYEQLDGIDAGSWKGAEFAGTPVPRFSDIASFCITELMFANVEIKPCPGREQETGKQVAQEAARYWQRERTPPLLSSFSEVALLAARKAAPDLPRGLLIHEWVEDWGTRLRALDAVSLHCNHEILTAQRVADIHAAGYRVLAYTVNDKRRAQQLIDWGVDGLFTDELESLPAALAMASDI
ncbi:glycerophosphodiester phosphodiesterase [Silvimonas sp. JCM 19000]